MKFIRSFLLPLAVLCMVTSLSPRSHADPTASDVEEFRKGEVVVEIKPGAAIESVNGRHRTTTVERMFGTNFYRLRTPRGKNENKWLKRLAEDQDVLSASLNPLIMSPSTAFARSTVGFPDGHATPVGERAAYISQPDLFNLLDLSDAQLRSRGAGVVVAIIDTGVDRTHPDLAAHLWRDTREGGDTGGGLDDDRDGLVDDERGWDFVDNDNDPTETADNPAASVAGHGTFIAGLVALVAPECRIMPIRAFAPDGTSNAFTVAAAIKYAVDHGANIINLSFGSPRNSGVVREAIKYARQNGATLVAAMGNENKDTDSSPQYPAVLKGVLGVAAIDAGSRKAAFSNFGSDVRVDALGLKLTSTYPGVEGGGGYATWSGTSFAAPLAAAAAALVLAEDYKQDASGVIEDTAIDIDGLNPYFSGKLGRGRINPLGALASLFAGKTAAGNYATVALNSGPGEPEARGRAGTSITGSRQDFKVVAQSLNVGDAVRLVVDGKEVAADGLTVNSFGGLKVVLSNDPSYADDAGGVYLPLPADLVSVKEIKHVELRVGDRTVLRGVFTPVADGPGPAGQWIEKQTPLAPAGPLPQAGGKARVEVGPRREELIIEGDRLTPGASYRVLVDGIDLGWAVSHSEVSESGFLRVQLTSDRSGAGALPPSLHSVIDIKRVELRDSAGRVILQGDFLPGGGDIGNSRL